MKIIMTVADESRGLDLSTMPVKDASECERLTGMSWTQWREELATDRAAAVAFAWWLAGKREGVDQGKFSDVNIDLAQLNWAVELSDEEQAIIDATSAASEDADSDLPTSPDQVEIPAD